MRKISKSAFNKSFFIFQFYIGGVPNLQPGMVARVNFTGCMENLFINGTAIIPEMRDADDYYSYYYRRPKYSKINISSTCPVSIFNPGRA